ncbi:MAG: hypothetical protein L0K60_06060, partial [Tetragenococcus koreensis]|nr:hypothetical protein [Tetragenococcus koreensis]
RGFSSFYFFFYLFYEKNDAAQKIPFLCFALDFFSASERWKRWKKFDMECENSSEVEFVCVIIDIA